MDSGKRLEALGIRGVYALRYDDSPALYRIGELDKAMVAGPARSLSVLWMIAISITRTRRGDRLTIVYY